MVSLAWSCVAVGLFVTAPPPGCEAAPSESLTVPSARVVARIDSGRASYRLVGRMTMSEGYRMCAAIRAAPARSYSAGRVLWLAGRDGSYHSLTAGGRHCRRRAVWFDSHPPTLDLFSFRIDAGARSGAEDYLHAALLALGEVTHPGRQTVDFGRFDREPRRRNEDSWTVRPLVSALGDQVVEVRVGPGGRLERLELEAPARGRRMPRPVTVSLELSRLGRTPPIPYMRASAIE